MANCHKLFLEYNSNLNITKSKNENLITSRDSLRERIKKYFKENHPDYNPEFFIQGSYKMNTLIRTKDDTCDLDDGVHFRCNPDVSPTTLQNWVYNAVEGHTSGGQEHRKKCIRVIYSNDYHIDLPIYKQHEDDEYPFLAIKQKEWDEEESNPKGFIEWFNEQKTKQMVRLTKFLKAWGDKEQNKMPSGLAMTLFAEKYIVEDERDDIALKNSLIELKDGLMDKWEALMPTKPEDDIIAKHDKDFQDNFFDSLNTFIEDAEKAIKEDSQLKASKLWRKHLGNRFPLGDDDNSSNKKAILGIASSGSYKPYFFDTVNKTNVLALK